MCVCVCVCVGGWGGGGWGGVVADDKRGLWRIGYSQGDGLWGKVCEEGTVRKRMS